MWRDGARYVRLVRGPLLSLLPSKEPLLPGGPGMPRDPRRAALVGLIVTLLLVVGGLFLVRVLERAARLQDCVMSGRTSCAPIDAPSVNDR